MEHICDCVQASATVTRNQLLLSISGQGPLSIISLRSQPTLGDFYAEATVKLSLCGGKDQIRDALPSRTRRELLPLLGQLRWPDPSRTHPFRFHHALSTTGCQRRCPHRSPVPRSSSACGRSGSEMRFFLNDHFQFTFRDRYLHSGTLGFFAYANGAAPITVSFSDLSVYSVAYASPTPSLTPSRTPTLTRTPIPSLTPTP